MILNCCTFLIHALAVVPCIDNSVNQNYQYIQVYPYNVKVKANMLCKWTWGLHSRIGGVVPRFL